jgi:RHS repeat-associated protein
VELIYGYNGPLVTSEEWVGDTEGTVSRVFNSRGLVTSQQINGSSAAAYTYDDDDLMLTAGSVTFSRSPTTGQVQTLTLSNTSQSLIYDTFGDVDGSAYVYTSGPTDIYEYDDRSRLERVEVDSILHQEYTYDPNGNRLSVTTTGGTTYATYDEQDRIIDYGPWDYTHGANGEVIAKTDGTDDWEYEYDALGNLLLVTLPDTTEIRYEYDGRGRPVARYVDDVFEQGWLWGNQLEPIAEVSDDEGTIAVRYVYGSRAHVPDYMIKDGVTYRIITDYRGSVVRVVKASDGTLAQAIEYGPWGEVLADSNPGFQSFGDAGGIYDPDTKLVLFGARWYDPGLGRWMSKDPILFDGGQGNLYLYVDGDPIDRIDPEGLSWFEDAWTWFDQSGAADFIVGWGDTVSFGLGAVIRKNFTNLDDVVNYNHTYSYGVLAGLATQAIIGCRSGAKGEELAIGANGMRVAPWGNRGNWAPHPTGRYPHYHRQGPKLPNGQTRSGQGGRRHRPWDLHPDDVSFWDRF